MSHTKLLKDFGNAEERLNNALKALQENRGILLVDDENRENEGDLIFPAESITPAQMALMIRECSGIVCLCLTPDKAQALELPLMVKNNQSHYQTAFTISIEAAEGVSTGVSAADRVTTIRAAVSENAKPEDLHRPGHVFPLIAKSQGVLEREGHTEGTIDLMQLAGLKPAGVLCELTMPDGTMARLPEIINFANKYSFPVLTIQDIIQRRRA